MNNTSPRNDEGNHGQATQESARFAKADVLPSWPLCLSSQGSSNKTWLSRDLGEALEAYAKIVGRQPTDLAILSDVIDEYIRREIAMKPKKLKQDALAKLENLRAAFGKMKPDAITAQHCYTYMFKREAPGRAKKEIRLLSTLFVKAIKWGAATKNPVRDMEFDPDKLRDRYPEPWELDAFKQSLNQMLDARSKRVNAQLKLYIDLKSLIGLRMGDMLKLVRPMIQDEHFRVQNNKTRKVQRFWFVNPATGASTGLRELLEQILALPRPVTSVVLFCRQNGQRYSEEGFKSIWQRRMRLYEKAGGVRFWEHDVRATAAIMTEEAGGDPQKLLAHAANSTTQRYIGRRKHIDVIPMRNRR